jgi:polysaccharide export outer membrane protein
MSNLKNHLVLLFVVALVFGCKSSKEISSEYLYFQNNLDSLSRSVYKEAVVQPNDLLNIVVFSKTLSQAQAGLFNIPNSGTGEENGYVVDIDGNIELPLVGTIRAAGLTRKQLSSFLTGKLSTFVKDPSVLVKFASFKVEVLGEVRTPGTKEFKSDRVTIIDAISAAGDLTEEAKRKDILIIREEATGRKYYRVDLRNGAIFQSPAYQLQQNDIVYVEANNFKFNKLRGNSASQRALQISVTLLSLATSILSLVYLINNE